MHILRLWYHWSSMGNNGITSMQHIYMFDAPVFVMMMSKMADLSTSEIRTEFGEQKRVVSELHERLGDVEYQINEGEKLRKKLHNTILELKGNIHVFCRVRPLLPDDCHETEYVVSFLTSGESFGQALL